MPKILLDTTPIAIESSQRGIGRFVSCLIPNVAESLQARGWEVVEACVWGQERMLPSSPVARFGHQGFLRWLEPWQRQFLFSRVLPRLANQAGANALFATETTLFPHPESSLLTALMMYDLIPLLDRKVYVDTYRRGNRWLWNRRLPDRWRSADLVVPITHEVARTARELLGVSANRLQVAYPGVDHLKSIEGSNADIGQPFFLYVGAIEARKNVERLVQAFARLRHAGNTEFKLVLAGPMAPFRRKMVETWAQEAGVADHVLCLGRVEDARLQALYKDCLAFVFPSLLEGFGLPPLEAMRAGAAVVAARASCLPEVLGEEVVWVDGHNVSDMAQGMERIATDSLLRHRLGKAGPKHAERFTWKDAGETIAVRLTNVHRGNLTNRA